MVKEWNHGRKPNSYKHHKHHRHYNSDSDSDGSVIFDDPTKKDQFNPNPVPEQALKVLTHAPEFKGATLSIAFRIEIIKLREIRADNIADLVFSATQTWHIPEIKTMFNDVKDADLPTLNSVEGAWHPPLLVLNADVLTETLNDPIIDWKEGDITRKVYFNGTVTNELSQIRLFPFDWDDLRIICTSDLSQRKPMKRYILEPEEGWTAKNMIPYFVEKSVQEWEVVTDMSAIGIWNQELYKHRYISDKSKRRGTHLESKNFRGAFGGKNKVDQESKAEKVKSGGSSDALLAPRESAVARSMQGVEAVIHVRRRFEYYIYKIILVFNLIIAMSWAVCASPHYKFLERMEVISTSAAALFAFMFSIQADLPKLPFLTFIDKLMISGIFSMAFQTAQTTLVSNIDEWVDGNYGEFLDYVCSIANPGLYILYNLWITLLVRRARSHEAMLEVRSQRKNMQGEHGMKAMKMMGL